VQCGSGADADGVRAGPRVRTGNAIDPGLTHLHNHVVNNALSVWSPPGGRPLTSRYDWPSHSRYLAAVKTSPLHGGSLDGLEDR